MPKNIIICADGTGNTTIRARGTNVFKLYEAVDQDAHRFDSTALQQIAIYHDGVARERRAHIYSVTAYWLMIFTSLTYLALILGTYYADLQAIDG